MSFLCPCPLHRDCGAGSDYGVVIPSASQRLVTSPNCEVDEAAISSGGPGGSVTEPTSLDEVPASVALNVSHEATAGGAVDGAKTLHDAAPGLEHMQEQRSNLIFNFKHVQPHIHFQKSAELISDDCVDAPTLGLRSMGILHS